MFETKLGFYTLSPKNWDISNAYISYTVYPISITFCSYASSNSALTFGSLAGGGQGFGATQQPAGQGSLFGAAAPQQSFGAFGAAGDACL